eukprot:CAMPEP_0198299588 /NCGR_PEP_ID=MMETSP1449-20131203/45347_1 /TAXON_ID=420275 /ORGANISM="Attheya septentrionalis, Strain CCMP2084" /LENGTH=75 /DNA_ID=CAMNT_0044001197 /DNA_START=35 /DNA_END=259 /DNA_ORIENTATION=+
MEEWKWKDRLETPLNACSLEILIHNHEHHEEDGERQTQHTYQQFMVIGCYELQDGVRKGELRLHRMEEQTQTDTD